MTKSRSKRRTHIASKPAANGAGTKPGDRSPKSMVIRIGAGEVGPSISQLVKDVRMVVQPDTAIRLKERKNNKLRDYTTMTGPLGITHLFLFSKSPSGNTNLRVAITPRGPTLHFRVETYSLMKDVMQSQKHPKDSQLLYLKAPLLVMNNFTTSTSRPDSAIPKHLEQLVTTIFQTVFPPLNPQSTPLSSIKRVLLLNRETSTNPADGAYIISLRHYAISTQAVGVPKAIKRLRAAEKNAHGKVRRGRGVPNLGKLEDVADWMIDPAAGGYTSGSESEPDTDAEVEVVAPVARKLQMRTDKKRKRDGDDRPGVEKRGVKLTELGPRMRLRLMKVEDGLCTGKVMWHEYIHKTKEEEKELEKVWEQRRKEKEERKRIQRQNLERKRNEKASKMGSGDRNKIEGDEDSVEEDFEDWDSDMLDAAEEMNDDEDADERNQSDQDEEMEDGDEG